MKDVPQSCNNGLLLTDNVFRSRGNSKQVITCPQLGHRAGQNAEPEQAVYYNYEEKLRNTANVGALYVGGIEAKIVYDLPPFR